MVTKFRWILDSGGELQQKATAAMARGATATKTKEDDSDAPQIAFSPTIKGRTSFTLSYYYLLNEWPSSGSHIYLPTAFPRQIL